MASMNAIDFGSLVGAQLSALIEAEAEGAEVSSEYIENVGFEKDEKTGTLRLRMVTFQMNRRDVDGKVRTHTIQVPVLTLVPIPLLTIEEAEMEFDMHIEEIITEETKSEGDRTANRRAAAVARPSPARPSASEALFNKSKLSSIKPRARLVTRLARTTKEDTKTAADLSMKVKIAQSPFPVGIERLINIADLSVEDDTDE